MKILYRTLLLLLLTAPAWAQNSFVIKDIRVEGLQRITAGTVFNYLPVSVGSTIDSSEYPQIIRALFKTGFFSDVNLSRDGNVLVVHVTERPAIAEINIEGNKDISTDKLKQKLRQVGLAEGKVFDRALLDKVEQQLLQEYYSRGKYAVRINSNVRPLPRNRVAVTLNISEGVAARIRQINIVGNHAFSDGRLRRLFKLSTPGWFTLFTKADQYSKEKLTGDLERLRSFYLDHGYLKFHIDSTQVSLSPDKKSIYITINVTEGALYKVSDVELTGKLIFPKSKLMPLLKIHKGDVFSRTKVGESAQALVDKLGGEGYAFANANAQPKINEANHTVALDFVVDPGNRVYIRRITFSGNTKTQDHVLRREMRQAEGAWFSTTAIKRSQVRLQRLPYLSQVAINSQPVPGTNDQVDLHVKVQERPAGSLTFGIGYGQTQGLLLNAGIQQKNFLGTGNEAGFTFNNSSADRRYSINYNNPYFTPSGVSRGFELSYESTNAARLNTADYVIDRARGMVNFGFPLSETNTLRIGGGVEGLKLKTTTSTPQEIINDIQTNGSRYLDYKLESSFARDSRNRTVFPSSGTLNRVSLELALPGSDAEYYKISYDHQSYFPLTRDFTLAFHGFLGYGDSYGSTTSGLPFWEKYLAGGLSTVRGFKDNTLGPTYSDGSAAGGDLLVVGGTELISPIPFLEDSTNFRVAGFFDVGNVYARPTDFQVSQLRYSVGVSLQWMSPLGPLAFSIAQPLNKKPQDHIQRFQFSLGIPF